MKNAIKMTLAVLMLGLSSQAFAQETLTMQGTGLDGNDCEVRIVKDDDTLQSVELNGASQVFEILSETGSGYGTSNYLSPRGGQDVLKLLQGAPKLYSQMNKSEAIFSDTVTYSLDTSDIQAEEQLKGLKMIFGIELTYANGQLHQVRAATKAKALWVVPLASSSFECYKRP